MISLQVICFQNPECNYADDTTLTSSTEDSCVLEHKMNYEMNLILNQ